MAKTRRGAPLRILLLGSLGACVPACGNGTSDDADAPGSVSATSDPDVPGTRAGAGSDGASSNGGPRSDAPGREPEGPAAPYVRFDVNHVLSTGQSNSVANDGHPVLSTTQPHANLMFDVGVMTALKCDGNGCTTYEKPSGFVPLVEGDTYFYPVETMSAGLANLATTLAGAQAQSILVSVHGRSGNAYACLRKGGCDWWPGKDYLHPFAEAMTQVSDAKALAGAAGKTYVVRAVTAVHGETDHYAYASNTPSFPMLGTDGRSTIADYTDALLEWQRDYETGVKEITGQALPVPLFINQYSHWNNVPTTKIAFMQLEAHVRAPGKVIVVGPTYALPYGNDCLHFTNHGERQLGEYFAKAYARVIVEGRPWEPLRPVGVALTGNVVTVRFHVPSPPLVFDTTRIDDPGNYGFEWYDGSGAPPAITNVALTGPDTVAVTLASAPTGEDRRLRYAYTFRGCSGARTLARGNLRDSDTTPSDGGYDLFNWAVHFDAAL
jgi:hypothetical protein